MYVGVAVALVVDARAVAPRPHRRGHRAPPSPVTAAMPTPRTSSAISGREEALLGMGGEGGEGP